MVLSTFLITDGLKVLTAIHSLLNVLKNFLHEDSQFKLWFKQSPKQLWMHK